MKTTLTRVSMILMAVILVFTAGCSSKNTTSESAAPSQAAATESATPQASVKPLITLKIYSQQGFPGTFTSGEQMDEVSKEVERVTGVKLEWDMQPSDDKTKALIASNDLPD